MPAGTMAQPVLTGGRSGFRASCTTSRSSATHRTGLRRPCWADGNSPASTRSSPEPRFPSAAGRTISGMEAAPATGRISLRHITYPKTRFQWFSTSSFKQPVPLQWGTSARNAVVGPGRNTWNLAMFKAFQFHERATVRVPGGDLQHLQPHAIHESELGRDQRRLRADQQHLQSAHPATRFEVHVLI